MQTNNLLNYLNDSNIVPKLDVLKTEAKINAFVDLLIVDAKKFNLMGNVDKAAIMNNHVLDVIHILEFYNLIDGTCCCDIGSGAGFPGLVLAILKPHVKFTLLESNNKKIGFLEMVSQELQLDNITIVNDRAEVWARKNNEAFDYVTARAVASTVIISELGARLLKQQGLLILWKGPKLDSEIDKAHNFLPELGLKILAIVSYTLAHLSGHKYLILKKFKPTHKKYPRPYSQIKREFKFLSD